VPPFMSSYKERPAKGGTFEGVYTTARRWLAVTPPQGSPWASAPLRGLSKFIRTYEREHLVLSSGPQMFAEQPKNVRARRLEEIAPRAELFEASVPEHDGSPAERASLLRVMRDEHRGDFAF